jgi:hypothetical protein
MATTKAESNSTREKYSENDDAVYPPFKIVLPAMVTAWLVFFVVALVRTT